jgi:hypothetical protein
MRVFKESVAPMYSDRLLISQNGNLTTADYIYFNDEVTRLYGAVDILVVDGLSMMGGSDTEVELTRRHTKELKAYANETGQCVFLIVHVSRGMGRTKRDVSELARGGEKIIDNCDMYICFSNIIDHEMSTSEDDVYKKELVYARFVNKRGSGNVIDKVLSLNEKTLHLEDSGKNPHKL